MKFISALICFSFLLPVSALALESNDPLLNRQWYLEQIRAQFAWDTATGTSEVIVAILDSGVDLNHPDLESNIWINTNEVAGNGIDDDSNGYIDDIRGWDFVQKDNDPSPAAGPAADPEAAAHGSLVAGLVGATGNNGEGVAGVAWDVSLMPLRALNNVGSGSSLEVSEAIYYAVENGADVINLSFSGSDTDSLLSAALEYAYDSGVVVVAALGNEDIHTSLEPVYPSCYGLAQEWVIGVAATNRSDSKASFSNYGECADLAAPGVEIYGVSLHEPAQGFVEPYENGWSGTSMSAPLVAGSVALMLSAYPNLSPDDIRIALQIGVDPVVGPFSAEMGAGRLNVAKALEAAKALAANTTVQANGDELSVGDPFKSAAFSSVYILTVSGDRRVFVDANAYFTHFDSFDPIHDLEDANLGALAGLVLPKAGTVLVKIPSIPTVYALEENSADPYRPKLRAIASEEIAIAMYGANWADYVIDIDPSFFTHFGVGEDIDSPEMIDLSIMKTRAELANLAS